VKFVKCQSIAMIDMQGKEPLMVAHSNLLLELIDNFILEDYCEACDLLQLRYLGRFRRRVHNGRGGNHQLHRLCAKHVVCAG
jgi:hypothetical protein